MSRAGSRPRPRQGIAAEVTLLLGKLQIRAPVTTAAQYAADSGSSLPIVPDRRDFSISARRVICRRDRRRRDRKGGFSRRHREGPDKGAGSGGGAAPSAARSDRRQGPVRARRKGEARGRDAASPRGPGYAEFAIGLALQGKRNRPAPPDRHEAIGEEGEPTLRAAGGDGPSDLAAGRYGKGLARSVQAEKDGPVQGERQCAAPER